MTITAEFHVGTHEGHENAADQRVLGPHRFLVDGFVLRLRGEKNGPVLAAVAFQLFASHVARLKDRPIDKPCNLAKIVTV